LLRDGGQSDPLLADAGVLIAPEVGGLPLRGRHLKLVHGQPSADLAGETNEREAIAVYLCQDFGKWPGFVGVPRPTVVPELLIIQKRKPKWLWGPTGVGNRKRMAVVVPSTAGCLTSEFIMSDVLILPFYHQNDKQKFLLLDRNSPCDW